MPKKSYTAEELHRRYGQSKRGHFYVKDTIGVPHAYMITASHVCEAADHHSGILNERAIEDAEKNRIYCGICKGKLKFHEHEIALLVACKAPKTVGGKNNPELEKYLKSIVSKCEEDGYVGFSFIKET